MRKSPNIIIVAALLILGVYSNCRSAEELKVTTYYPSPYGSYANLTVADKLGVKTTSPASQFAVNGTGSSAWEAYIQGSGTSTTTYGIVIREATGATNNFWIRDDGAGYLRAAAWTYGSDRRLKEDISYFDTGLDKILVLKPARFNLINGEKNQVGFVAQDVEGVIPEAVTLDKDSKMLGLKTDFIVPYLVNSVKELHQLVQELKEENKTLKARLGVLESQKSKPDD